MMNKTQLRQLYLKKRKVLNSEQIQQFSIDIANQLLQMPIWGYNNYHLFLSIKKQHEIDTTYIMHVLMGKDKNILISKSNFKDYSMTHHLLTDQTIIQSNSYGIPEPVENGIMVDEKNIHVVFVPLLAYDKKGSRVGYGKGFYDRFLHKCPDTTIKIGLSFFKPVDELIVVNDNDLPLDYVVTPSFVYDFI